MGFSSRQLGFWLAVLSTLSVAGCANVSYRDAASRPFFQKPYYVASHGRKTWWDRLIELDPGEAKVKVTPEFLKNPPERIAVLPFVDEGTAQYVVDKLPITMRDREERERWAWTDAQRLRHYMVGYLATREFIVLNTIGIDAVLAAHGIRSGTELAKVSPQTLGRWLHADAVVYGTVTHYEAYYFFLVSAEQVSMKGRFVSTRDGHTLISFNGGRYHVNPMPAIDPIDMMLNSAQTLMDMRDINIARAEDEACREVVIRIPRSKILRQRLIEQALENESGQAAPTTAPSTASSGGSGPHAGEKPLATTRADVVTKAAWGQSAFPRAFSGAQPAPRTRSKAPGMKTAKANLSGTASAIPPAR